MNFSKPFPTGFQGAPTCRRSLSPVQMSVGMPGTRLFTRSYTKTFSSQLAKQSNTGQSRGYVSKWSGVSLSTHPTPAPVAKWVPCFLMLVVTLPGLCKRNIALVRAGGEGVGKKAFVIILLYFYPFFKSKKKHSLGNLGNTMPVFLPVQERHLFSILPFCDLRICLDWALLQQDVWAGTRACTDTEAVMWVWDFAPSFLPPQAVSAWDNVSAHPPVDGGQLG